MKIDLTYHYLTHHVVPGPQSFSYFIPLLLLPTALLIPRTTLSQWQNMCIFIPIMTIATLHAWYVMDGTDVISSDVLFQALFFLVFQDPWTTYEYVAPPHKGKKIESRQNGETSSIADNAELLIGEDEQTPLQATSSEAPEHPPPHPHGEAYPSTLRPRIDWVLNLLSSIRLNNWRIGNPSHDATQLPNTTSRSRTNFLLQSLLSFVRGYLVLDLTRAYISYDPYFIDPSLPITSPLPFKSLNILPSQLVRTMVIGAQAWALISQMFYVPAAIPVMLHATGLVPDAWSPHTWVPFFGPAKVIFTSGVRGFWGGYWHQTMRWMTSGLGYAVSDALRLHRRSVWRYAIISLSAFGLSGITHIGLVPPEPLHASVSANTIRFYVAGFFWLQPLAMMAEVLVLKLLGRILSPESVRSRRGSTVRTVTNAVWLVLWFSLCLPLLGEAGRQLGYWRVWPMPVSVWRGLRGEGWVTWPFLLA